MWPDQPYAESRGSFRRPVPVFTEDTAATPAKTVVLPCSYLPYVRGALQQLLLQATWQTDDPVVLQQAQDRASTLISLFEECPGSDLPFACPYDFEFSGDRWVDMGSVPSWTPPDTAFWDFSFGAWIETCHDAGGGTSVLAVDIGRVFSSPVHLTGVNFSYFLHKGSFSTASSTGFQLWTAGFGALVHSELTDAASLPDTSIGSFGATGDWPNVSIIRMLVVASNASDCSGVSGGAHIFSANVDGEGIADCG